MMVYGRKMNDDVLSQARRWDFNDDLAAGWLLFYFMEVFAG